MANTEVASPEIHAEPYGGPRPSWRLAICGVLYAAFMGWAIFRTCSDYFAIMDGGARYLLIIPIAGLLRDLWGVAAGVVIGVAVGNFLSWTNLTRTVIATTAFGFVLGFVGLVVANGLLIWVLRPFGLEGFGQSVHVPPEFEDRAVLLLLVSMPVTMGLAGAAVTTTLFAVVGTLFAFFVGLPVILFNQIFQFEKSIAEFQNRASGMGGYIARFFVWLYSLQQEARPDDSKGARFATTGEIRHMHNMAITGGRPISEGAAEFPEYMGFGHMPGTNTAFVLHTDKHVLIMASTRSGKGVSLIVPHLLRYRGSVFCLDPKGENAIATWRFRRQISEKLHILDPFGITGLPRSRYNPLSRFRPDNMEAESKALAAAMFVVGGRGPDHWTDAGQQLLATFILYVYLSPDVGQKDLVSVRQLLLGFAKPTLEAMKEMDEGDGLLAMLATSFLNTPQNEFGSILSTAQRQTEILDNPYIQACLAADGEGEEIDFEFWRGGVMSVYLCLSAPRFQVFNRWLRLILTSALDTMTETLSPPPMPVTFMLDELATLGHLQVVENAIGLVAGYGVQIVSVWQDVGQLQDLYKGRWTSFVGNSGVRAVFNVDDFQTAEYWSKFIGNRTVDRKQRSVDHLGYDKGGTSISEGIEPLLTPEQLMMQFASKKILVLPQGQHPVITDRTPYFDDDELVGRWDDPRRPIQLPPRGNNGGALPPSNPGNGPAGPAGGGSSSNGGGRPIQVPASQPAPVLANFGASAGYTAGPQQQPRPATPAPTDGPGAPLSKADKKALRNQVTHQANEAATRARATDGVAPHILAQRDSIARSAAAYGIRRTEDEPNESTSRGPGAASVAEAERERLFQTHKAHGTLPMFFELYPEDLRNPNRVRER